MKQLTDKNKKIFAIVILAIIIVGIIVIATIGFNKELKYEQAQRIDIYIEQQVNREEIKGIANEVLGKDNMVETIEIYEDMVTIRAKQITEQQKNEIVTKVKENYEFKQIAEETSIEVIPETRIVDMYKNYVIPFIISGVLILVYMLIRYYKKGILKVLERTIMIPIVSELVLLSIIAITRLPLGRFTPIFVIAVYVASILTVVKKNEEE